MKRQAIIVTVKELKQLIRDITEQQKSLNKMLKIPGHNESTKFQINIINKTPECSDTWEIEQ